jgi:hypothetical protein
MRGWTIGGLIALVAILAMGMASLRDPECEWAEIAPGAAAAILVTATAFAILRRGRAPACMALTIAGGSYFLASWPLGTEPRMIPIASSLVERIVLRLDGVTNPKPVDHSRVQSRFMPDIYKRPEAEQMAIFEEWQFYSDSYRYWDDHRPNRLMFARRIAHAWLALALGGLAAIASSLIFGQRSRYDDWGREAALREHQLESASEGAADGEPHVWPCP